MKKIDDHNALRKEMETLASDLSAAAQMGDKQAAVSLGLIGVAFAHQFQGLAVCDESGGTEHTRPYFEISGYAPGKISGDARNRRQVETIINLGRKWSKLPWQTWDKKRKNVNFADGLAAMANEIYRLCVRGGLKFKSSDKAFEYGFSKMVEAIGGRNKFLELYGPARQIAESVKRSKSDKFSGTPPVSVQFAEVKSKVKRTFKANWND